MLLPTEQCLQRYQKNLDDLSSYSELQQKLADSKARITDLDRAVIEEVKSVNDVERAFLIKELRGSEELRKVQDYVLSITRLKLLSAVLERNVIEATLTLDVTERDIVKIQENRRQD